MENNQKRQTQKDGQIKKHMYKKTYIEGHIYKKKIYKGRIYICRRNSHERDIYMEEIYIQKKI